MVNSIYKLILVLVLLLIVGNVPGQQVNPPVPNDENLKVFEAAEALPDKSYPSSFEFSVAGYKYVIGVNGRGKRFGSNSSLTFFNVGLGRSLELVRVYYAKYEDDLLFLCEDSDGESGAGFITRLDGRTLKPKWKRPFPAFNVGQGLIENKSAYLTGMGFIAKVDLNSGRYIWQHSNLYRHKDDAFNSFDLPEIEGNMVLFTEEQNSYRRSPETIKVMKRDGRIIKVND